MAPDNDLRERREKTVSALFDAINAADPAAVVDLFSVPRFELIAFNRVYDGRGDVMRYLEGRGHAFPDQQYELISLYHADEAVIAEFWMTATHLGEVGGLGPPTRRRFRSRMAGFFLFEGANLVCERVYFDAGTIARQLA